MRLLTLMFFILVLAVAFALLRDEVGRVAVIVFVTGLGVTVGGLAAIMSLFQTLGAFGEARTLPAHVEALAASALVLAFGSGAMLATMFAGAWLVRWAIP